MNRKKKLILFVCTGNICRSPMAEHLFKDILPRNAAWRAQSAGLMASQGQRASTAAVATMRELHLSISSHRSQPVTRDLIDDAFCIVVMTRSHASLLGSSFSDALDRVHLLRSFDPDAGDNDVDDPIGMGLSVYRQARNTIRSAMPGLLQYLNDLETN